VTDEPTEQQIAAHRNDGYRRVGRFMVVFSQLIVRMYNPMWPQLRAGPEKRISEQVVANEFFADCKRKMPHDKTEKRASKALQTQVDAAIELRRAVAHWSWEVGYWSRTGGQAAVTAVAPFAIPFGGGGMGWAETWLRADLDHEADQLVRLVNLVSQYGDVCYGTHGRQLAGQTLRVDDVLRLDPSGKPAGGPYALPIAPSLSGM
jgi:hypothetical protein